ncbi:MAG TPA: DNA alkylation repair protein [Candidatus Limnocylindria bacterium]|nr:DNA alkylation repair protein [Candidatus Limnocylindria bacterium]
MPGATAEDALRRKAIVASAVTQRAQALVAERLPQARGLGETLGELVDQPEEFVAVAREGLLQLADEAYAAEQGRVTPGQGVIFGVRNPLLAAVARQLKASLKQGSDASALWLAERLVIEPEREFTILAHTCLLRSLPSDPERTWQLMRKLAHAAHEWISVDSLAVLYAAGILREHYRWAELEQLVYAAGKWERRLVGATIAQLPHEMSRADRPRLANAPGLTLIKSLIGDAEPDVQKALSWALRSWLEVDSNGVRELIRAEADDALRTNDGHRAWVLRDALTAPVVDPSFAAEIRARLEGVRRDGRKQSTSQAAETARGFVGYERLTDAALEQQGARQQGGAQR